MLSITNNNNSFAQGLFIPISGSTSGQSLTTANAGADITQSLPDFMMNATPPSVGTGQWSVLSGAATITTPNAATTTVTGIAAGTTATLRWTVTDGSCSVYDDVVLTRTKILLSAKVILEGAYNASTGKMNDALRTNNYIPTTEPYTALGFTHQGGGGGETINASILTTTGDDAIVDWIFVELRSKNNPATVLATRSGLLQRDGDIVDINGTSPLSFNVASDQYYIAIRHRNHIGFRTATTLDISSGNATLNTTSSSVTTHGNSSRKTISGILAMYAGDTNLDGSIDANDFRNFRQQYGQSGANRTADFNLNGDVDANDLNLFFRDNYGIFNDIN